MVLPNIQFIATPPPVHYTLAFEPFLYNQEAYLRLKEGERHSFYAVDHRRQQVLARIHFLLAPDDAGRQRAVSLPQSPFGSVEYGASADSSVLLAFVEFVVDALQALQVSAIEIRDCIAAYRSEGSDGLVQVLNEVGFEKKEVMANHHIWIDDQPLEKVMHRMERKKLRKCKKASFVFREEPLSQLTFYYRFLSECRLEKGWNLSMSLETTKQVVRKLPDSYKIFALYDSHQCIAACLGVVVNHHIFYDFYHDALQAYAAFSPVVMLVTNMYYHLRSRNIKILDMGTSLTPGLQSFKAHLGGQPSSKVTFVMSA